MSFYQHWDFRLKCIWKYMSLRGCGDEWNYEMRGKKNIMFPQETLHCSRKICNEKVREIIVFERLCDKKQIVCKQTQSFLGWKVSPVEFKCFAKKCKSIEIYIYIPPISVLFIYFFYKKNKNLLSTFSSSHFKWIYGVLHTFLKALIT